jgi:hypothetical protein
MSAVKKAAASSSETSVILIASALNLSSRLYREQAGVSEHKVLRKTFEYEEENETGI